MTLIGTLAWRGAAAASAIGAAAVLALAPQPGFAGHAGLDEHSGSTSNTSSTAPSAACVAARNAFVAALKADVAEDTIERNLERSGANTNDPTEDQTERAGFKPLISAMVTACAPARVQPNHPAPTAQCTSAKQALAAFLASLRAQEKGEWANHTEGTAADRTEDQASWAHLKALFQAAATACGFQPFATDRR